MLFVALMNVIGSTEMERAVRRSEWDVPPTIEIIGEYWLHTPYPEVIVIFESDCFEDILPFTAAWNDVYDISIYPAATASDGMEALQQMLT